MSALYYFETGKLAFCRDLQKKKIHIGALEQFRTEKLPSFRVAHPTGLIKMLLWHVKEGFRRAQPLFEFHRRAFRFWHLLLAATGFSAFLKWRRRPLQGGSIHFSNSKSPEIDRHIRWAAPILPIYEAALIQHWGRVAISYLKMDHFRRR